MKTKKEKIEFKDCKICVFVRENKILYCSLKMKDNYNFSEYAKVEKEVCMYFKEKKWN